jgi:hypothetical protein
MLLHLHAGIDSILPFLHIFTLEAFLQTSGVPYLDASTSAQW